MGMVVDSASQVVRIPADQIEPPPPVLGGFSQEFITGVGKLDDKLVILLNADAILTVDERIALSGIDHALPGAGPATET
jgi:purine-binding chemotaxis protein CheW